MDKNQSRLLKWLVLAGLIIAAFLTIILLSRTPQATDTSGLNEGDWYKGNPDAKVTIIEYSDFQCPACKSRLAVIEPLIAEFSSHINFVYRHFPLRSIHKNSQLAAQAAEAAGLQGKFWEMHDIIFGKQSEWSELGLPQVEVAFGEYAEEIGLDLTKFKTDLHSAEVKEAVNNDYDAGNKAKITGTPTFFLNGQQVNITSYEQGRQIIRDAIEEN